jgi:hypothetical protein
MYLDNAKIYRSDALKLACAQLNIELLHRPPRDPSPGGIIERVIQTAQVQYEVEVRAGKVLTLSELNRYYQAWLSADYHLTKHSQTGQTPRERCAEESRFRRNIKMPDAREFFHVREERRVDLEFSDVRVKNQFYKADIYLRGDKVIRASIRFHRWTRFACYRFTASFSVSPNATTAREAHTRSRNRPARRRPWTAVTWSYWRSSIGSNNAWRRRLASTTTEHSNANCGASRLWRRRSPSCWAARAEPLA